MKSKTLITSLLIVLSAVLLGEIVFGSRNKLINSTQKQLSTQTGNANKQGGSNIVFFYGNTCPHCAEAEKWMQENKVEEKIPIVKKEVYDNRQNAEELIDAARSCGLPTDNIGVPFLYAEGKCLIGTPDVMSYLSQKAGITPSSGSAERSKQ
jgi:glutaredoxin